jgi:hypothetical protein
METNKSLPALQNFEKFPGSSFSVQFAGSLPQSEVYLVFISCITVSSSPMIGEYRLYWILTGHVLLRIDNPTSAEMVQNQIDFAQYR